MVVLLVPSWPTAWSSEPVTTLTRFIPTYYMVELLEAGRTGTVDARLGIDVAVIAACIAVTFAAVVWVLRRAER